jgi:C4-dicarboxylate transporter DctM subunit
MIPTLVFGSLILLIALTRIPLGFVMMITGAAGVAALHPRGWSAALAISEQQVMDLALNYQFSVLPLFILMGVFVVKAGMAREMFEAARRWLGHHSGGLGMATIVACGGFSAMCASSAAAAATMTKIAVPEMDRAKYDKGFSAGTVAAGGTLGILIPPSGALIIYALLTEESVSKLFVAGILPGLFQIFAYIIVMGVVAILWPKMAPKGQRYSMKDRIASLKGLWGVILLFGLIMVGLTSGWFTATEAGGIGAGGALMILAVRRKLSWTVFVDSLIESARIAGMIFVVSAGALVLNQFINLSGIPGQAVALIDSLNLSPMMVVLCFLVFYLILGCMMDGFAMIFLTVPVVAPIISSLGFDLVWWGIVTVLVVEISLITPPVGLNVFILKAMLPKVPVIQIFKGILPFLFADIVRLGALVLFPAIALWLPSLLS